MVADFLNTYFYNFDTAIYHVVGGWQSETMNSIMHFITFFGCRNFQIFMLAVCLALLIPGRTRKYGMILICAIGTGMVITSGILKPLIARPRPYIGMLKTAFADEYWNYYTFAGSPTETDYSFPSGHTTFAFDVVTCLVVTMIREKKHWAYWLIPVPFLIGFTRIYLCIHYPTDVIVGMCVGLTAGIIGAFLGPWLCNKLNAILDRLKAQKANN